MSIDIGTVPSIKEAAQLLEEASKLNPGSWVEHSINTGKAALILAGKCSGMDCDTAYSLGILHDIGRRKGVTSIRHIIDGYKFLTDMGYEFAARVCLTHSYPYPDIRYDCGTWDCTEEEIKFISDFITNVQYTDYDRLIQLCDALSLPEGICVMEKRMVDVVIRYGFNEYTIPKWRATLDLKKYFEDKIGGSIYGAFLEEQHCRLIY